MKLFLITLSAVIALIEATDRTVEILSETEAMAQCPAHNDGNPSLSLKATENCKATMIHCFAGCEVADIAAAIGYTVNAAQFPTRQLAAAMPLPTPKPKAPSAKALDDALLAQFLPPASTKAAVKVTLKTAVSRRPVATYAYQRDGHLLWEKVRVELTDAEGNVGKTFTQNSNGGMKVAEVIKAMEADGRPIPLFNGDEAREAIRYGDNIFVVEGEKDAILSTENWEEGATAVCTFGGAGGKIHTADWDALVGAPMVTIIADKDGPGIKYARAVASEMDARRIPYVCVWSPLNTLGADLSDHVAAGLGLKELELMPTELFAQPVVEAPEKDKAEHDSWSPIDLTAVVAGTEEMLEPTIMLLSNGQALLYPGLVHSFNGESESGKSLLVQMATAQELLAGRKVLYIDYEDNPRSVVKDRLMGIFKVPAEAILAHLTYVHPEVEPARSEIEMARFEVLLGNKYSLVIMDGVTEALSQSGANGNDAGDFTAWASSLPQRLANRTGAAVALVDHVNKSTETRGRFAAGSYTKMSSLSGGAYLVDVVTPLGRGRAGELKLYVAKDRPGAIRGIAGPSGANRMQEVARFKMDSTGDASVYSLDLFEGSELEGGKDRKYIAALNIYQFIKNNEPIDEKITNAKLEKAVTASKTIFAEARDALLEAGFIVMNKVGQAHVFNTNPKAMGFFNGVPLTQSAAMGSDRGRASGATAPSTGGLTPPARATSPSGAKELGTLNLEGADWDSADSQPAWSGTPTMTAAEMADLDAGWGEN